MPDPTTPGYEDVFLAVLSMDTYMRDSSDSIANLSNLKDQSALGNATIERDSTSFLINDQATGFFAQSYVDPNYGTIISYRGIPGLSLSEVLSPLNIARGAIDSTIQLAAQFYQQVTALSCATPFTANAIFTGHSEGGALAGIISSVYGKQAVVFDNTGFENVLSAIRSGVAADVPSTLTTFYGSVNPADDIPPIVENVRGFAVSGDIAALTRAFQNAPVATMTVGPTSPIGPIDRHNSTLTPILTYGYALVPSSNNWMDAASYFTGYLFSDPIAKALGITSAGGNDEAYFMRAEIAYSAIGTGTMPYGDTGIASLYADVGTLGDLLDDDSLTGLLDTAGKALGEIAVQFAGDQAAAANTNLSLAQGAFELDGSTLKVDLDPGEWTSTFQQADHSIARTTAVVGLGNFFNAVLSNIAVQMSSSDPTYSWTISNGAGFSAPLLKQLNEITQADIALSGGDLSAAGTPPVANDGTPGGALLVGGEGQGSITGSANGNDIIVGGSTVTTGDGNDIILAGGNPESVTVGKGNNLILADSAEMSVTLTYAGATGASGTTPGDDLVVGNSAGGDTFTFNGADKAAFTVVWGGSGDDTFDIKTTSSASSANVLLLTMSGVTASNITSLDMSALQSYVDKEFASYGSSAPMIVILNASSSDTLKYNGSVVSSPGVASSSYTFVSTTFLGDDGLRSRYKLV